MKDAFGVESISKGRYSDDITSVQSHRQKANRRRKAGNVLLGAGTAGGVVALAHPDELSEGAKWVGNKVGSAGERVSNEHGAKAKWYGTAGRDYYRWSTIGSETNRANKAGLRLMRTGARVVSKPRLAVAGVVGGTLAAGAGLKGAGMAHNAYSNKKARAYNKTKANSKIKIVPVSGKNRF